MSLFIDVKLQRTLLRCELTLKTKNELENVLDSEVKKLENLGSKKLNKVTYCLAGDGKKTVDWKFWFERVTKDFQRLIR